MCDTPADPLPLWWFVIAMADAGGDGAAGAAAPAPAPGAVVLPAVLFRRWFAWCVYLWPTGTNGILFQIISLYYYYTYYNN